MNKIFDVVTVPENPEEVVPNLRGTGCYVSPDAQKTIQSPAFNIRAGNFKVGLFTAGDLQLTHLSDFELFGDKGEEALKFWKMGLLDAGSIPAFRRIYEDQPMGETIWCVHRPICVSIGSLDRNFIFTVECCEHSGRKQLKVLWLDHPCDLHPETLIAVRIFE